MKHHFPIPKITLSVSLIVLSIAVLVNRPLTGRSEWRNTHVVAGVPLPPPTQPHPILGVVETVDGVPLPPPTLPPPKLGTVLPAYGVPFPPPSQPPPMLGVVMTAAGVSLSR